MFHLPADVSPTVSLELYTILPTCIFCFSHIAGSHIKLWIFSSKNLSLPLELQKATPGIDTVISSGITKCVHHFVCETDAEVHVLLPTTERKYIIASQSLSYVFPKIETKLEIPFIVKLQDNLVWLTGLFNSHHMTDFLFGYNVNSLHIYLRALKFTPLT